MGNCIVCDGGTIKKEEILTLPQIVTRSQSFTHLQQKLSFNETAAAPAQEEQKDGEQTSEENQPLQVPNWNIRKDFPPICVTDIVGYIYSHHNEDYETEVEIHAGFLKTIVSGFYIHP